MKKKDIFLTYNKPFQWIADRLFDSEKYFVFTPWCQRIGHQLLEILIAISIAKRDNKTLVLISPHNPVNKDIFDCQFNCKTLKNNWKTIFLTLLIKPARFFDLLYKTIRLLTLKLPLLPELPVFFFYPRYGIEKGKCWQYRLKGTSDYHELDILLSTDYEIRLSPKQQHQAEIIRKKLSIPSDAKIVCLHVRECGYLGSCLHNFRDASIANYIPSIRFLTSKGYYVVRIGDPSMTPLPKMDNVIDYAHSAYRSSLMDLYFSNIAFFFIAADSGPGVYPWLFNKPSCKVNLAEIGGAFPLFNHDIGIPKHIFSYEKKRILSFKEVLAEVPPCFFNKDKFLFIENTPLEILETVKQSYFNIEKKFPQAKHPLMNEVYKLREASFNNYIKLQSEETQDAAIMLLETVNTKGQIGTYYLDNCWEPSEYLNKLTSLYNQ